METAKKQNEEQVLRRVFNLCYLNSVSYANYRQLLNPDRLNESKSSTDYTMPDYNYVTIRRGHLATIYQAIIDQPGPTLSITYIEKLLQRWEKTKSETELAGYCLDKEAQRLVRDSTSLLCRLPLVIFEICPRKGTSCFSFLISFLKEIIPDLMGDRQFEDLTYIPPIYSTTPTTTASDPMKCITCDNGRRELTMMISCHYKTCSECNKREKEPLDCPICQHKESKSG